VNRSIPADANDLGQSLGVILIILVDLHLERGARVPRIEANHFEAEIAQFMHNPWRHRAGFDPYPSLVARVSAQVDADLFWNRGALTSPYSPAVLSTTQIGVIFCETSRPIKWGIDESPKVRITGRHRPDRGTIGGSRADRDYPMSIYV
jgi:hypothetical protein